MALSFELVVSHQLFSAVLVAYKWFKIQRHLPSCGVNVTSEFLILCTYVNFSPLKTSKESSWPSCRILGFQCQLLPSWYCLNPKYFDSSSTLFLCKGWKQMLDFVVNIGLKHKSNIIKCVGQVLYWKYERNRRITSSWNELYLNAKAWLAIYFKLPHPQLCNLKALRTRNCAQLAFLIVAIYNPNRNFIIHLVLKLWISALVFSSITYWILLN